MAIDLNTIIDIIKNIDWAKLSLNVIFGYAVSWIYFIATLSIFQKMFGKVNGGIINYSVSWIVWLLASYLLHHFTFKTPT